MAKNKVFVGCYDYDNDKAAKDRLLGWDVNQEFDLSSYDQSFGVAINSPVMFRNRACLSALFVQYSPALRVPPDCRT